MNHLTHADQHGDSRNAVEDQLGQRGHRNGCGMEDRIGRRYEHEKDDQRDDSQHHDEDASEKTSVSVGAVDRIVVRRPLRSTVLVLALAGKTAAVVIKHVHVGGDLMAPLLKLVVLVLLGNVLRGNQRVNTMRKWDLSFVLAKQFIHLPHNEEDSSADQAVLNRAGKQERARVREQLAHYVMLAVAQADEMAQIEMVAEEMILRCP